MLYVYHQRGFSNVHEQEQLDTILPVLNNYYRGDRNAYLLANINFGGVEPDAMLVTTNYVVGIEFKNYGSNRKDNTDQVVCTENGKWNVLTFSREPKIDTDGNTLSVKGGTFNNPYDQANHNRKKVNGDLSRFLQCDVKRIGDHVFWFIVFNRYMKAENQIQNAPWLKILTNESIVHELNNIKSDRIFNDDIVIRSWLEGQGHGITDFCLVSQYKAPEISKESPKETTKEQQLIKDLANNYPEKADDGRVIKELEKTKESSKGLPNNQQLIKDLTDYYAEKANQGRVLFLFIMSLIMSLTTMFRWWWNTSFVLVTLVSMILVALAVWYIFERRTTRFFRDVPKDGEIIGNRAYIYGLNKFNWFSIVLNHVCWLLVAFLLIELLPKGVDYLPSHRFAFYDLLKLMSVLLFNCGIAIAVGTIISLFYRIYEKITDVDDKGTIISKLSLSMMPISRLDISLDGYFVRDLRRWIRILIYMSAMVSIFWFVLTLFWEKELVKQKYTYWPFVTVVDPPYPPEGDTIQPSGPSTPILINDMFFKEGKDGVLRLGENLQLHFVVMPAEHDEELKCDWNKDVAEVRWKGDTFEVTPKKQGLCRITVSSNRSNKTAVFGVNVQDTIRVSPPPSSTTPPTTPPTPPSHTNIISMSFKEGYAKEVRLGEKLQLHLNVVPANHDEELKCEWTKDVYRENVAVVSMVGNTCIVKPMKRGECLITVTSSRTGKEASFTVRVL